jgi:hypothetical protein
MRDRLGEENFLALWHHLSVLARLYYELDPYVFMEGLNTFMGIYSTSDDIAKAITHRTQKLYLLPNLVPRLIRHIIIIKHHLREQLLIVSLPLPDLSQILLRHLLRSLGRCLCNCLAHYGSSCSSIRGLSMCHFPANGLSPILGVFSLDDLLFCWWLLLVCSISARALRSWDDRLSERRIGSIGQVAQRHSTTRHLRQCVR